MMLQWIALNIVVGETKKDHEKNNKVGDVFRLGKSCFRFYPKTNLLESEK